MPVSSSSAARGAITSCAIRRAVSRINCCSSLSVKSMHGPPLQALASGASGDSDVPGCARQERVARQVARTVAPEVEARADAIRGSPSSVDGAAIIPRGRLAALCAMCPLAMSRGFGVLQLVQPGIIAIAGQQLLMAALLDNAPLVQDDDAVDVANRGEAVGNDDRRPAPPELVQRILDERLRLVVHASGGFIQNQ